MSLSSSPTGIRVSVPAHAKQAVFSSTPGPAPAHATLFLAPGHPVVNFPRPPSLRPEQKDLSRLHNPRPPNLTILPRCKYPDLAPNAQSQAYDATKSETAPSHEISFETPIAKNHKTMKITRVDQFSPRNRTRLIRISTDSGIEGWAESTLEGKPQSVPGAIDEFAGYLIGKDPLRIEHHWQGMYRSSFFRGGIHNMSAIAAIDAALWDIAGKHYGVPSYMLMGGNVRDRIRVYAHWGIRDLSD